MQMDQRKTKLMTMYKALHPSDDVDRLYVSRKEERGGLASIRDSVTASTQGLYRNAWRVTDYSILKRYWQYDEQQNDNY